MKSKGIAYLLHIFLGVFGAGRFYVGDIGMGILNLLTGLSPAFRKKTTLRVCKILYSLLANTVTNKNPKTAP